MTLVRWNPFYELKKLSDSINQLFDENYLTEGEKGSGLSLTSWSPSTDIYETKDEYVFKIEVPGMNKDDVKVEFTEDTLTIKGERKEDKEIKKENFHRIERFFGSFQRSFTLPKNIDEKKIKAELKDGILELRVPKVEKSKTKAIPITIK